MNVSGVHEDIFQWLINVNGFTKIFSKSNPSFRTVATWQVVFHKTWDTFLKWLWKVDMNLIPNVSKQFTHGSVQLQQRELQKLGWNFISNCRTHLFKLVSLNNFFSETQITSLLNSTDKVASCRGRKKKVGRGRKKTLFGRVRDSTYNYIFNYLRGTYTSEQS